MKLEIAERIAAGLIAKLEPFCEMIPGAGALTGSEFERAGRAIVIAGSIRRRRPQVNDIDLVAIPKLARVKAGLFDEGPEDAQHSGLAVALCSVVGKQVLARGPKLVAVQLAFEDALRGEIPAAEFAAGVRVDLYLATPETFPTVLLIRTGSKEHNIWLAQRARELGGKLHADGSGLELPDPAGYDHVRQCAGPLRRIASASEDEILAALCFGSTPVPEAREIVNGKPAWLSPQKAQSSGGSQ